MNKILQRIVAITFVFLGFTLNAQIYTVNPATDTIWGNKNISSKKVYKKKIHTSNPNFSALKKTQQSLKKDTLLYDPKLKSKNVTNNPNI